MKNRYLILVAWLLLVFPALAQDRTITGKVTSQEDSSPVPGANVLLKGTTTGAITNAEGVYKITVPSAGGTLIFSFIGKKNGEEAIGQRSVIDIALSDDARQLSEIVVTALGERRERKALGYSVQEIKGDNLTFTKSVDVNSSLAGKIAGVQLSGSPSSSFDNANIVIRGINTLAPQVSGSTTTPGATGPGVASYGSTGNNPLYIVDGTPTDQQNIIMDNVESISVLKGASATALYGNRAANGVVLITTKRGTRKTAPKIDFNLGASFENLYITPKYQNQYAGGYASNQTSKGTTLDDEGFMVFKYNPAVHPASWASFNGQRFLDYGADESWGPKINGQEYRAYWSWFQGPDFGKTTTLTAHPDNVRNFFRTGVNLNNTVSVSGGGEKSEYRITYANQHRTLTIPNAYRNQHQVGLTGSYDVSKRLRVSTDLTLTSNYTQGKPIEGYNSISPTMVFNQWFQRQLDVERMKDYRAENGAIISWNIGNPNGTGDLSVIQRPQYMNSPYFSAFQEYGTEKRTRLSGNIGVNYLINDIFNITANARTSMNMGNGDFRIGTGGKRLDSYSLYYLTDNETNLEANLNFKKTFGDLSLTGFVGSNIRQNRYQYLFNGTTGGLSSPNYFDIAASITRPTTGRVVNQKDVQSVYGKASLGYKNFLYVDGTLRNDWSSALPVNNNSYLYPSISGSFVFSELIDGGFKTLFPYAKVRASYAQVGSDLGFNQVNTALVNGSLYNGNPSVEIGNQYRTGQVKPALSKSWEVGTEFRLLNKLNVDFAYYVDNNINQILSLDVSATSGYSSAQINAGNIQRKGWELSLSGTPFQRGNFSWNLTLNLARNVSFVKDLTADLNTYTYATSGDLRVEANKGQKWGNLYGRNWVTNAAGLPVFSAANGTVSYTTGNYLGNIQPDLTGGLYNTLSYGPVNLSFSVDFQKGGLFYSTTKMFNVGVGSSAYTVGLNDKGNDIRDFPAAGGGVRMDGVLNEAPLTVYVPARLYYYTNYQRDSRNVVLDASYLKLREIRLGYAIPTKLLSRLGVSAANIGILVNNALLLAAPAKKWGLDPSEIENYWYEGGQLGSSRTTGFNVRLTI